ncbi:MAG TPA: hypothetical protein PLL00_15610 [Bacteroidia bacterium]|nr:hypothetical protein [Bacteroidia bacterium]
MLTTKKVIEDAIKVRENKIKDLEEYDPEFQSEMDFVDSEIENYTLEIAELKQSLQIIYLLKNRLGESPNIR